MIKRLLFFFAICSSLYIYPQTTRNVPAQYSTIQAALNAAQTGDTVLVQPGTYYENIIWPNVNGIKLFAAGDSSNTIIDGKNISSTIYINPINVIVDTLTQIEGFRIQNGGGVMKGGGIFVSNAGIYFNKLSFENNSSILGNLSGGNAIYMWICTYSIINNCRFNNNYSAAGGNGGAIAAIYSNLKVVNSIFTNNQASVGGAIYTNQTFTDLEDLFIKNNIAATGGGISVENNPGNGNLIHNCKILNNTGGGIEIYGTTSFLIDSTIIFKNYSSNYGGGVYIGGGVKIKNSIIASNYSIGNGGGLYIIGGTQTDTIYATSIIDNASQVDASAIYFTNPTGSNIFHCTFDRNFTGNSSYLIDCGL